MLRLNQLEELRDLLLELPTLTDRVETGDRAGFDNLRTWLRRVEEALHNNRLPLAGEIAALRAQLALARQGVLVDGLNPHRTPTPRKIRGIVAADVVRRAGPVLAAAIAVDLARAEEADRLARQLVTVAHIKDLIDTPVVVRAAWDAIRADPDIASGAMHMLSLVGPEDSLIVLDRAISRDLRP